MTNVGFKIGDICEVIKFDFWNGSLIKIVKPMTILSNMVKMVRMAETLKLKGHTFDVYLNPEFCFFLPNRVLKLYERKPALTYSRAIEILNAKI